MSGTRRPGGERRILVIGYQGFANIGDEAILTGIEALLAGEVVRVAGVVCGPYPASVAAFPSATRISAPRLLPTQASLRALWSSDALVLGGGGLIHDHWPIVIPRYLGWIAIARLFGKRVVWVGVGVGPIRRRFHRLLARLATRLTTLALVRDRASAELLGGETARVAVIPDPTCFNPFASEPPGSRNDELAIILRGPTPRDARHAGALAAGLAEVYRLAGARGWRPVLMTMGGPADEPFLTNLRQRLSEPGPSVAVEQLGPTPRHAIERLAEVGGVISVRLHGLVLASLAGAACVPVAYDDKVSAAAAELGIADLVVATSEVRGALLLDRLAQARSPERMRLVRDRVDAIRQRMPEVAERVMVALGTGG